MRHGTGIKLAGMSTTFRIRIIFDSITRFAMSTGSSSSSSSSGGGVMSQDHAAPRLNGIVFIDERRGWVVGAGGSIFATTDGGRSWQPQTSSVRSDLLDVKFISATEGFAAGADGTIVHTTNSGATWHRDASGTTLRFERLFFANAGSGWAVGFGGAILHYTAGVNN